MSDGIYESDSAIRITVFTPTYNRAYILNRLYLSLQRQSFTCFEWLIVDDGSTDDTEETINKWIDSDNAFAIRYYKKPNGGKHRAVNYGLQLAKGEIFFVVDSDDYLTDDALEKIDHWFLEIEKDKTIVAIAANKGISTIETPNARFKRDYLDSNFLNMQYYREDGELVLYGEKAIAFYTNIHRKYLYPEFENEKFLTEAIVYNRIAHDGYKTRFFNDIICIFQYMEDGLSADGTDIYLKNPYGYGLWFKERADFLHYSLFRKVKMYYSLYCDLKDLYSIHTIAKCLNVSVGFITLCEVVFSIKHPRRR